MSVSCEQLEGKGIEMKGPWLALLAMWASQHGQRGPLGKDTSTA